MPLKLTPHEGEIPRELQLDLLVDAELDEADRRRLIESIDGQPGEWRALALRFLQRQVERESVRNLMAGGSIIPVEINAPRPVAGWIGSTRMLAVAAGLLIAATSALITVYVMQMPPAAINSRTLAGRDSGNAQFFTNIPADAVAYDRGISMNVPLVKMQEGQATLFPSNNSDDAATARRSWVIQSDGQGHAVVIPVNTLKAKVY